MRSHLILCGLFSLTGLLVVPGSGRAEAPPELKKLHVLLVLDTNSTLGSELRIDGPRLRRLFGNLPRSRVELTTLTGRSVSRKRILDYYSSRKVGPDEGLLFFYGGHGGRTTGGRHQFFLNDNSDRPLYRDELRKAMEAKKAGLVVLLTDCCSNTIRFSRDMSEGAAPDVGEKAVPTVPPVLRNLLLQARGTVDITAATGDIAYGDEENGGLFTRTFCRLATAPGKQFDRNGDGFVTWQEFFSVFQKETESAFHGWSEQMRKLGEKIETRTQKPQAFALGKAGSINEPRTLAVVTLRNRSRAPVHYRYRWSNEETWHWHVLAPGGHTWHGQPATAGGQVNLLVEVSGKGKMPPATPRYWKGKGSPTARDGAVYDVGGTEVVAAAR